MYNTKDKEEFIEYYTKTPSGKQKCIALFGKFEEYEKVWEADLSTRTVDDIRPVIEKLASLRTRTRYDKLRIIKDYVKWCSDKGKDNVNLELTKISLEGVDEIQKFAVYSPAHLQQYLDNRFNPESDEGADNLYRCFYWLAYSGVVDSDLMSIKISDIDVNNMVINYRGRKLPIYREALPSIKNCMYLKDFRVRKKADLYVVNSREEGDTLMRTIRKVSSKSSLGNIQRNVCNKEGEFITPKDKDPEIRNEKLEKNRNKVTYNIRLSYSRAWFSGIFFAKYQRESFEIPDFYDIADLVIEVRKEAKGDYKLDKSWSSLESKRKSLAREYAEDYERWKLAFRYK